MYGLFILPRNFSRNSGRTTSVYILLRSWSAGFSKITFMIVAYIFIFRFPRNRLPFGFAPESYDTTLKSIKTTILQNCGHP